MKFTKYLMLVPALAITASFANAKEVMQKHYKAPIEEECVFRDYEFAIDGFVAGLATSNRGCRRIPSGIGGGVGATYYFLRYFGLGAEAWWTGSRGYNTIHNFSGIFQLRYPICSWNLAPYALVGGGVTCNGSNWGNVQVGGGLEWRPWHHLGFFADGRAVFPGGNANTFAEIRLGVRVIF